MFHLLYTSSALNFMSSRQLEELLVESRTFNADKNITGILLYCDGSFMQLLEGDEEEVQSLFGRIETDRRHFDVRKIFTKETESRWMKDWAMAFALCAHRGELESCINIARDNIALREKLDDT
ncbi:MAG: BLUF domain-containing protein [Alphaproteobacteria bacterium]